uniref:Protein SRG1-like n=1 Tax=Tanacetum cinerariifolium TaxID=118510 RepID=A0A6L2L9F8_TANCI|nr:protein SRG1-like [Tanacetum cinerariifolium]
MSTNEEYHGSHFHEATFINQNGELQTSKIPVVQELAREGLTNQFPKRFITLPQRGQLNDTVILETPPVIDIANLKHNDTRKMELQKLAEAAKEWGVFLIKNHGVDDTVLDDVKDVVKGFFSLSFEEKKVNVGTYRSVDNMGYGKSHVKSEDQPLDWVDRLTIKAAPVDESTNHLRVWPRKPTNFRQSIEKYVEKSRKVLDVLLEDLAESIALDKNAFLQYFEPQQSEIKVRVNYYPPCPRPDLAVGILPHSDPSGVTLLLELGATGSLQVQKGMGWATLQWPNNNNLLVNIGDLLEIMSNGMLKSAWHQVRTQLDVERISLAYFYNPPPQCEIGPTVNSGSMEEIYKKVVVEDYVSHLYKISPTTSKEAIMYAKDLTPYNLVTSAE